MRCSGSQFFNFFIFQTFCIPRVPDIHIYLCARCAVTTTGFATRVQRTLVTVYLRPCKSAIGSTTHRRTYAASSHVSRMLLTDTLPQQSVSVVFSADNMRLPQLTFKSAGPAKMVDLVCLPWGLLRSPESPSQLGARRKERQDRIHPTEDTTPLPTFSAVWRSKSLPQYG